MICLFHKWETIFEDSPRIVQRCRKCGRMRSTMYDMSYGCTYWVRGDEWSASRLSTSPTSFGAAGERVRL